MKWLECFVQSLNKYTSARVRKKVLKGSEDIPSGSSKKAKYARSKWISAAMDMLDSLVDEKTRTKILVDTCPHKYPKTRIKKMKDQYEKLGDIDKLLDIMCADTSWGGGSFYDYPVRKGDVIYITKVPYNPKAFEKARTSEEKRLAYCHCGLVKRSEEKISSTFCCCSGGWVKQLWEGILEIPLEVELTESLLQGDECCTHAFHIPSEILKKQ